MASYTVDVEYIVYRKTNIQDMDQTLIALARDKGGEWSASDFGPINTCLVRPRRDNAFYFEDWGKVKEFISSLSSHPKYRLDTVYVNIGEETHKIDICSSQIDMEFEV